jgi:hypothetical protein
MGRCLTLVTAVAFGALLAGCGDGALDGSPLLPDQPRLSGDGYAVGTNGTDGGDDGSAETQSGGDGGYAVGTNGTGGSGDDGDGTWEDERGDGYAVGTNGTGGAETTSGVGDGDGGDDPDESGDGYAVGGN